MAAKKAAKRGRPTAYTKELSAQVLDRLTAGETLRAICKDENMPAESTVRQWVADDRDGFSAHYTRAREVGYLTMADELLEIADDAAEGADRSRLRVDTRKWLLSKALPKVFGDKLDLNHSGEVNHRVEKIERTIIDPEPTDAEGISSAS